ncbi:WD40-repeat-containing domain protein [Suillus paluster]|uniref:WD40-repeat-containing domain protein n=1 Tax=Suillus paluster TaxID=48578 RepID=UPI001B86AA23|nr:WD40-repeat-containing domain protein [Suillus paluster]KAG1751499.1 WD40-repeat-containing domain protein [Suillus paluster]
MASSSMQPVVAANKSILTPVMTLEGHKRFNYNLRNGERDLYPQVRSISYFPDGKQMISGALDMTIRRWDLREGKEIEEVRDVCEQRVDMLEVSRDGRWVVTAGGGNHTTEGGKLKVCEVETGFVRIFQSHSKPQWIQCIDISPDSTLLAAGSIDYILDGIGSSTARIWNLDTGKLVAGPFKNDHCLGSVRFSRDSKKLAVMLDIAKRLEVWDVQTQKLVVSVGNSSYSGDWTLARTPVFWTTQDKTIVAAFSFKNFKPRIDVRDDPITIYEFDASILEIVGAPFKGHTRFIANLALSFDCALLASTAYDNTAYDNTIKLWAFQSRQLLASFDVQLLDMLIYSPNSHQLAYTTLGDTKIHIYDIPLDILASIRPTRQEKPSTSASKIPDLFNVRVPILLLHCSINASIAVRRNTSCRAP